MNQITVKIFLSVEMAKRSFVIIDKIYDWVRHSLEKDEEVDWDSHPTANEWVLLTDCHFAIAENGEPPSVHSSKIGAVLVHIPKGISHWFKAMKPMEYEVFKDREEKADFLDRVTEEASQ